MTTKESGADALLKRLAELAEHNDRRAAEWHGKPRAKTARERQLQGQAWLACSTRAALCRELLAEFSPDTKA